MPHLQFAPGQEKRSRMSAVPRVGGLILASAIGCATVATAESAYAVGLENPAYAPSQWTVVPESAFNNGVNFTVGSSSISLGSGVAPASASINAAADGIVSFLWSTTLDPVLGAGKASVTIGSAPPLVLNPTNGFGSSGSVPLSFSVAQGDLIRFDLAPSDNGNTSGAFGIGSFDAPIPTPAMLPGLIGMGVAYWRKKNQQTEEGEE